MRTFTARLVTGRPRILVGVDRLTGLSSLVGWRSGWGSNPVQVRFSAFAGRGSDRRTVGPERGRLRITKMHTEKYWTKRGVACLLQLDD